jgi:hypothetical protein
MALSDTVHIAALLIVKGQFVTTLLDLYIIPIGLTGDFPFSAHVLSKHMQFILFV